jgi:hypothetical protein
MKTRGLVLATLVALCLAATACERTSQGQDEARKFTDSIPLEYGNLIAATTNSLDPRWVTLWFEKPDKSIVIVGVDQHTWKVWTEPRFIGRK